MASFSNPPPQPNIEDMTPDFTVRLIIVGDSGMLFFLLQTYCKTGFFLMYIARYISVLPPQPNRGHDLKL